jgi:hypothetical protein
MLMASLVRISRSWYTKLKKNILRANKITHTYGETVINLFNDSRKYLIRLYFKFISRLARKYMKLRHVMEPKANVLAIKLLLIAVFECKLHSYNAMRCK